MTPQHETLCAHLNAYVFDIEIYPNFCHIQFKNCVTEEYTTFESSKGLASFIYGKTLIGFNNKGFDDLILWLILNNSPTLKEIHELCQMIITSGMSAWSIKKALALGDLEKDYGCYSIDLMQLMPLKCSLKVGGSRLAHPVLQELPIDPNKNLTDDEKEIIRKYCTNDLAITDLLLKSLSEQIELRQVLEKEYKTPMLLSKGDAALAESVLITNYISKKVGESYQSIRSRIKTEDVYKYEPPKWIKFETKQLQDLLKWYEDKDFTLSDAGRLQISGVPQIFINGYEFQCSVGGLHVVSSPAKYKAEKGYQILEGDWSSFYPCIQIQGGFFSQQLDKSTMTDIFDTIIKKRIHAKKTGDKQTNESLKIVINSAYGKLSDTYSILRDNGATLQVTVTGQLTLLMMIERATAIGATCISANTDGATFIIKNEQREELDKVMSSMGAELTDNQTGLFDFNVEYTHFEEIIYRDVNTYIAKTTDGKIKEKGALLSKTGIRHNATNNIVKKAVQEKFFNNIPFMDTIKSCTDIQQFITIRKVNGGCKSQNEDGSFEEVGSVIRYYYSTKRQGLSLYYVKSGNTVPVSLGAMVYLNFEDTLPKDIDYDKYLELCEATYTELNVNGDPENNIKAQNLRDRGFVPCPLSHKGLTLFKKDFAAIPEIGTQTGYRCGVIRYEDHFYSFDNRAYPSSYKAVLKKHNLKVQYGGVCEVNKNDTLHPFPQELENNLYNSLTKVQQRKILLNNEDAIRASANEIIIEKEYKK